MFDLTGKGALVTGATGGIGGEIAKALKAAGREGRHFRHARRSAQRARGGNRRRHGHCLRPEKPRSGGHSRSRRLRSRYRHARYSCQ